MSSKQGVTVKTERALKGASMVAFMKAANMGTLLQDRKRGPEKVSYQEGMPLEGCYTLLRDVLQD